MTTPVRDAILRPGIRGYDASGRLCKLLNGKQIRIAKKGAGMGNGRECGGRDAVCHGASCVEFYQVLRQGSFTPPRRSGSPGLWTSSWTAMPQAASPFL